MEAQFNVMAQIKILVPYFGMYIINHISIQTLEVITKIHTFIKKTSTLNHEKYILLYGT